MPSSVTITSASLSPSTKTILCERVLVGLKRDINTSVNANSTAVVQAQTQGLETPSYSMVGVKLTGGSGILTYPDVLTLLKLNYTGSNAPTISITYGRGATTTQLVASDGTSTSIKVVLANASLPLDTSETVGAYLPSMTLNFLETA